MKKSSKDASHKASKTTMPSEECLSKQTVVSTISIAEWLQESYFPQDIKDSLLEMFVLKHEEPIEGKR